MLTTLTIPTSGRATVGGYDIASQAGDVRRIAGVALQEIGLDPLMKAMELLTIQGQLFGQDPQGGTGARPRTTGTGETSEFTERRVGKYSGGMRRRLDLALALVHEPAILFLDEPTTGLDPASRRDIWAEVRRLNQQLGMTIFLTTQYLEEADELADRVAIIDRGEIVAQGKPDELKAAFGTESINVIFRDDNTAQQAAERLTDMAERVQTDQKVVRLYLSSAASAVPAVVNRLRQCRTRTGIADAHTTHTGRCVPASHRTAFRGRSA